MYVPHEPRGRLPAAVHCACSRRQQKTAALRPPFRLVSGPDVSVAELKGTYFTRMGPYSESHLW